MISFLAILFAGLGTRVGRVQVVDYDYGTNAEFNLVIFQQTPSPQGYLNFTLDVLDLYTTSVLDREFIPQFLLTLQATDKGQPTQVGTGTVTVSVRDINDNIPFFNETLYEFNLSEKQHSGKCRRWYHEQYC